MLKLLAVANPFPWSGGNYRAMKSLINYPSFGIKPYLLLPSVDYESYDVNFISTLVAKGVDVVGCLGYNPKGVITARIRALLHPLIPKVLTHVNLKDLPSDVNAVLSFHEFWEALWVTQFVASKMGKPSIAVLQLPPFYASKNRLRALRQAIKIYYNSLYGSNNIKGVVTRTYLNALNMLHSRRSAGILKKYSFIIGISKAICVETGLNPSSRVYCMDPGVTLDDEDLKLINEVRDRFREKKNYVVFGGRPAVDKGIAEGLLAFKKITERFNSCKLYITGKVRSRVVNRLLKFAKRLSIEDKIVFAGFIPRKERFRIVREAKLVLYPSHVDGFPYAIAESLLLNTPVVAYDIPAIDIYYRGLEGVKIVKELDVNAMVDEAINILSSNKVEVEKPKLRLWNEIIEEEINLIKHVASKS
ncbi:MAG: hypothetical protein B7O98_08070 [Zestosphaera tikiterensis]|uniref:Glycosyl transferase family 1 domain-containing protein n=1 Tax=Zestosphaera tikiterensis TaxID=1973259 RepID=A0A2R7Y342_9CREN|nr:MAG: hypothetical protein B7O98_08070 [Zestosphaera tikiterensis]